MTRRLLDPVDMKKKTSFRVSQGFKERLNLISTAYGLSMAGTLELIVRMSTATVSTILTSDRAKNMVAAERQSSTPMSPTPYRLSPGALATIRDWSNEYDLSAAEVLEMIVAVHKEDGKLV